MIMIWFRFPLWYETQRKSSIETVSMLCNWMPTMASCIQPDAMPLYGCGIHGRSQMTNTFSPWNITMIGSTILCSVVMVEIVSASKK